MSNINKLPISRNHAKYLHKKLKKMSVNQVSIFLGTLIQDYTENMIDVVLEALNDEYGFGDVRQQRVIDAINKSIREYNEEHGYEN